MSRRKNFKPSTKQETGDFMSVVQWITFWTLLLSFSQWILYAKFREWRRNRHPEPRQGTPVNRCLYHLVTDTEQPWKARESWERCGRGYIVAMERQGLGNILHEYDVRDFLPAYSLGFTVKEEEDKRTIEKLQKQLHRRDEANKRLQATVEDLREQLKRKPKPAPTPVEREPTRLDPLTEAWHEWGACGDSLETIMQRKGWQRIAAPGPVHVAEEPEDSTQTAESVTEDTASIYADMTTEERTATMIKLKDEGKSYREIALLFGVTEGSAKGAISRGRKAKNNVVHLFGECSEGVRAVP